MTYKTKRDIFRYIAYTLEFFLLYVLENTPFLMPEFLSARPILLIPAAVSIAMYESETASMIIGLLCGLLIDFAGGGVLGFHALILCVFGFITARICETYIQTNFITGMIVCSLATIFSFVLHFIFAYVLLGYSYIGYVFLRHYLPMILYTLIFVPVLFILNKKLAITINA